MIVDERGRMGFDWTRSGWITIIALCLMIPFSGMASTLQEKPPADSSTQAVPSDQSVPAEPRVERGGEPKTTSKKATTSPATSPSATHRGKTKGVQPVNGVPTKIVVRQGGVTEPEAQIVSGMAPEEASRQRQAAERLLNSTGETLRRAVPGPLDAQRQETVSQIQNYMEGARSALKEGDVSRGHTLAVKANLLAEDLAKH